MLALRLEEIRPHRSVGAGRASGAVAFELVTFAKTSSSHIALLELFEGGFGKDFWLRFAFTAMQVSVLAGLLCYGTVLDLILSRLQGQGGAFRRCICGLFLTMPKQHGPKMIPYSLQHSPKSAEVGPKMAPKWP